MDPTDHEPILEEASTQYSDLIGTLAFDHADTVDGTALQDFLESKRPDLEGEFLVVGVDLYSQRSMLYEGGSPQHDASSTLYVVSRSDIPKGGSIHDLIDDDGVLPVIELHVPDEYQPDLGTFLTESFKRVHLRASRRFEDGRPIPLRPREAFSLDPDES